MKGVLVAASFLTRLYVPATADGVEVGASMRWFPLVGALIGSAGAIVVWILASGLAMPGTLTATIVVALGVWITGAIHLDGLADMADGFGGGRTRDEVLRIMRDPLIGSFGAIALVLVLVTKVVAVAELLQRGSALSYIVAAPTLSRWTIALLATWLPYARVGGGLGQAVTRQRCVSGVLLSTSTAAVVSFAALGSYAVLAIAVAIASALCFGLMARRRIGGVTGDVFGASVEVTETTVFVSAVAISGGLE